MKEIINETAAKKLFGRKIEYVDEVGCHPRLSHFVPQIEKNRVIFAEGNYRSSKHNHSVSTEILEKRKGKALIKVNLRRYSGLGFSGNGWSEAIYFCGIENGHPFIHRVQSGISTIDEAIEWLQPAEVKRAKKKDVKRQGDFYFVRKKKKSNMEALRASRHKAIKTETGWRIEHPEHNTLILEGEWKAVAQKTVGKQNID